MRMFTPAAADQTLPLVRAIVKDILRVGKELRGFWEQDALSEDQVERATRWRRQDS